MKTKISVWILILTGLLTTMCEINNTIIGSGELVDYTVDFSTFSKISIEGHAAITVSYGNVQKVTISAQENVYQVMDNRVSNGKLFIGFKENTNVNTSKDINVNIEIPTPITDFSVSGSGSLNISGNAQDVFNIIINGSGSVNSFDLEVENVNIVISGSGNCKVKATKNLDISISGAGTVFYKGNPRIKQSISGSGSINDAN